MRIDGDNTCPGSLIFMAIKTNTSLIIEAEITDMEKVDYD